MAAEVITTVQSKPSTKTEAEAKAAEAVKEAVKETVKEVEHKLDAAKPVDVVARQQRAEAIISRNVLWALGAGVMPFPLFDTVAITGIQLKMLKELSDNYELKFTSHIVAKSVTALASGIGSVGVGTLIGGSLAKLIPAVGTTLGVVSVPVVAAAFTRAVGKIYLMHFEAGGTLLDFDPKLMRAYFEKEYEKAKRVVAEMQAQKSNS